MQATKISDTEYDVLGDSGKTYRVTETSCTCPVYKFRHSNCKHMAFLASQPKDDIEIVKFINLTASPTYDELENKFGKDIHAKLQSLERKGEIIYDRKTDSYSILR
jgi:uncharacterized Zn finger protein